MNFEREKKIEEALKGILEIGKRDLSNPKYDGYFAAAREALAIPVTLDQWQGHLAVTATQLQEISESVGKMGLTNWTFWFEFRQQLDVLLLAERKS